MSQVLTKARAKEVLEQARLDIALLMSQQVETTAQLHRLIGITGEEVEPIQIRAVAS